MVKNKRALVLDVIICLVTITEHLLCASPCSSPWEYSRNKADKLCALVDFSYLENASCGEPHFLMMPDK